MPQRPNVLFIFTDEHARSAFSAFPNRWLHTPNVDALAGAGVHFHHSYCTAPVCSPSRASLVTGRMPHNTGVTVNNLHVAPGVPSMAHVFRDAGYDAAWTGKWHIPDSYPPEMDLFGFENHPIEPHLLGNATDMLAAQRAIDFLRRRDRGRPWLLALSLHNPHDICGRIWRIAREPTPPEHLLPPLPDNFDVTIDEPEFIATCRRRDHYGNEQNATYDWTELQWRSYLYAYYRYAEQADFCIGRVLDALHQTGQADDTLIVFTSDHGEGVAAHRWVAKLMFYEEEAVVPLILTWPGRIPAGVRDTTHLASGLDILPTMCDYAGVPAPDTLEGVSLRTVIDNPADPGRDMLACELQPDTQDLALAGRMIRTARFKYVLFNRGERPEMLFDLQSDPGETRNLAADPAHARTLADHRQRLAAWCRRSADPFLETCPLPA